MRTLIYLSLSTILFCCGLSVNAAMTGCPKDGIIEAAVQPYLKVLSCDQQLKHNRNFPFPDAVCTASHQSFIVSVKTETREGTGSDREQFLSRTTVFTCKVQASRLLPDLHAIIRSLIYPKHIFW
ncbi:hypothetical protein [Chitinophaga rhizophila]|uniref:Uncharacterized protein n=1 Tax=Chitinophaga rhizophila TaxID=2866212 RepID=A0ABS7GJD6_9BACT|nr:hypothetical protein [Chitinophaga rhizophila]MBW8687817.1 hypothetical protein [Chitinophaga rhizophila]